MAYNVRHKTFVDRTHRRYLHSINGIMASLNSFHTATSQRAENIPCHTLSYKCQTRSPPFPSCVTCFEERSLKYHNTPLSYTIMLLGFVGMAKITWHFYDSVGKPSSLQNSRGNYRQNNPKCTKYSETYHLTIGFSINS